MQTLGARGVPPVPSLLGLPLTGPRFPHLHKTDETLCGRMAARRGESTSPESLLLTGARQESDCRGPSLRPPGERDGGARLSLLVLKQKHGAGPPGLRRSWGIETFHLQDLLAPQAS